MVRGDLVGMANERYKRVHLGQEMTSEKKGRLLVSLSQWLPGV